MSRQRNNRLIREARGAQLVPFVGAGASCALRHRLNGSRVFPTWREFLERGLEDLSPNLARQCREEVDAGHLVEAATRLHAAMKRPAWVRLLKQSFEAKREEINQDDLELHRAIWRASRGLVVTTNFDDSLSWPLPLGPPSLVVYGLESQIDIRALLDTPKIQPVLWHVHGRIRYPETIVLVGADYETVYRFDELAEHRYRSALFSLAAVAASRSFLFVGFSLSDAGINGVLRDMHQAYHDSEHSHYLICREAEEAAIEARIAAAQLENVELIVVSDFGQPILDILEQVSDPTAVNPLRVKTSGVREKVFIRRRCRTLLAGTDTFRSRVLPMLAEHRPSMASQLLADIALDVKEGYEASIARAIMYEHQGRYNDMLRVSSWSGGNSLENANVFLFKGIALEKLGRLDEASTAYGEVLSASDEGDELHLCASFNAEVSREKDKRDEADVFAKYLHDRQLTMLSGEWLWTKAFNMELIRCTRREVEFRFSHLLDEALRCEIGEASTGFAKTVINWCNYTGKPLGDDLVEQVVLVARRAPISVRVPMLSYLQKVVSDPSLERALDDALDSVGRSPSIMRLLAREPDQSGGDQPG